MKISKEGLATLVVLNLLNLLILAGIAILNWTWLLAAAVPLLFIEVFVIYFFRDPERNVPPDENVIVSPADGRVVLIKDVYEERFLKSDAIQVSIFLSVFNVHVNRFPVSGIVKHFQYMHGQFLAAFNHDASVKNEQTIVGIETKNCRILFKQIAGLLARRIVFTAKENDLVAKGDRCGIIKFGSRVDVILPMNVAVEVKVGDTVVGGESVIGTIR